MKIELSIHGQRVTLQYNEVGNLLRALEFVMGGGGGSQAFGGITAHGSGRQGRTPIASQGPDGAQHFSEAETLSQRVRRLLGTPAAHDEASATERPILTEF